MNTMSAARPAQTGQFTITDRLSRVNERRNAAKVLVFPSPSVQEEIDVAQLGKCLDELADEQNHAVNTRRAYAADWRDFAVFCRNARLDSLPASQETVKLYLMHQAQHGKAVATLSRR